MTDKTLAEEIAGWPKMPRIRDYLAIPSWHRDEAKLSDQLQVNAVLRACLATCVRVMERLTDDLGRHLDHEQLPKDGLYAEALQLLSALKEEGL